MFNNNIYYIIKRVQLRDLIVFVMEYIPNIDILRGNIQCLHLDKISK